ncbi:MAG: OPT/YSL family transporter, partial [Deltaproteobacteria bacterium]|nr:OPT/YSL family transporter [Deltaproteobacteria bacterium]
RNPVLALRRLTEIRGEARPGAYLTTEAGEIRYVMDPGIGGVETDVVRGGQRVKIGKLDAPKARLMALIVDGIMTQKLPWSLVLLGAFIALTVELCGVSALPFAVGVYLPISTTTTIFVGGFVRWLVDRRQKEGSLLETESSPGVLMSSGFIAGGAICGVLIAVFAAYGLSDTINLGHYLGPLAENNYVAMGMFGLLAAFLWYMASRAPAKK